MSDPLNKCVFNDDRKYRYVLTQNFFPDLSGDEAYVLFVCLNPSTADEVRDDPTVRKCRGFAKLWGFSRMAVVNIFAWRSTDPGELKRGPEVIGENNNFWISCMARGATLIVAAWGNHGELYDRGQTVEDLLAGHSLKCFGKNKNGEPAHPLYQPYSAVLKPYP